MEAPPPEYDSRYLAGVQLFNAGEYFDAHEVWEDLWGDCPSADRRFYQALIQAAVALYHHARGNRAGASRLFGSGRRYMEPYRPHYHGLEVDPFWHTVAAALGEDLTPQPPSLERKGATERDAGAPPFSGEGLGRGSADLTPQPPSLERKGEPNPAAESPSLLGGGVGEGSSNPRIVLVPPPARWPDPCEARHD